MDSVPHQDAVVGEAGGGEVGSSVQSLGIHLAFQDVQTAYLTGKVDSIPHHDGVVGEDGGGEVGSGVQSLWIHLAFKAAQTTYLTWKVDSVSHHDSVVGEDGRGEVGSGIPWESPCSRCLNHLPDREGGQFPPP